MKKRKEKLKKIINSYGGMWGYRDNPFESYDLVEVVPHHDMNSGKGAELPEIKKLLRVGKSYSINDSDWSFSKRAKAKLVGAWADPVGFGNRGKRTDVRLKTEWQILSGRNKGKRRVIEDLNLDYNVRSKRRRKIDDMLWRKHGMNKEKSLQELKELIKSGKYK